ncbi:unnamed protein product [Anisakis simplex]|uniref:Oxidoreductase n=1 Tax=Anisakis simplex TaxID=6269 RepID=A0A0M3JER3_ANISI|nr:unnamed protein product [Anisakis simplex]
MHTSSIPELPLPRNGLFRVSTDNELETTPVDGAEADRVLEAIQKSGMQPLMYYFPAGRSAIYRSLNSAPLSKYFNEE